MPKLTEQVTLLTKMRMNTGKNAQQFAKEVGISYPSIIRFESGGSLSRLKAALYFRGLGIDLAKPETYPAGLKIVDKGRSIAIPLEVDTPQ